MRLTGAHITPACRENRTADGAWDEAAARMREVYAAQLARYPGCTITLWIARDDGPMTVALTEAAYSE